jgi:hypothetical protein
LLPGLEVPEANRCLHTYHRKEQMLGASEGKDQKLQHQELLLNLVALLAELQLELQLVLLLQSQHHLLNP